MTAATPLKQTCLPTVFPGNLDQALRRQQLPGLEAIRAIAAFLVVFYHHDYPFPGDLGVLAFFVLSGFLITWLLLKEIAKYGDISLKLFYLRRSLRIFPAFYAYWVAVVFLLTMFGKNIIWPQAWASFFYVNNYYQAVKGHTSSAFSQTWSLGVEEQFYLLWPVALIVLYRSQAILRNWVGGAIVAIWLWRVVLTQVIGVQEVWIYEAFDARADHLLWGCLLAILLSEGRAGRVWQLLCWNRWMPALTLALLLGEVVAARVFDIPRSVEFIVQPVLVVALIVQVMAFTGTAGWRWVTWPWLVYLGKISYSIYLHQQMAPAFVKPLAAMFPMVPRVAFGIPIIIASASLSYYFIELPLLRWKDKIGRRPERAET